MKKYIFKKAVIIYLLLYSKIKSKIFVTNWNFVFTGNALKMKFK